MASLVQCGKYSDMNKTYPTNMGYYMVKYVSDAYTLQEDTTCDGKISISGERFVKAKYMSCTKATTKWYWEKNIRNKS